MKFGFRVEHHDHAYVERRGGWEFFTHLRAGSKRASFRRRALARAIRLYRDAWTRGGSDFELCGTGLLMLQRAAFAVEDLGGLFHAFGSEAGRWKRLTSTTIPDLDTVLDGILDEIETGKRARDCAFLAPFCLGSRDLVGDEPEWTSEQREAANALADLLAERWRKQVQPIAKFWKEHREVAKSTMHGYPIVAGRHILGPPPAGKMAGPITDPRVPFAVVLSSGLKPNGKLLTLLKPINFNPASVEHMNRIGRAAADMCQDLCGQQSESIDKGYAVMIPATKMHRLPTTQQETLKQRAE